VAAPQPTLTLDAASMSTLAKIAEELGLSKSTVSRALRGKAGVSAETVQLIQEAAERVDYVPSANAAGLSTGRTEAIGVLLPSTNRWFYTTVLSGVDKILAASGYDVVLYDLQHSSRTRRLFHQRLLRRRVDGLIVLSTEFTESEYAQFDALGIPLISVGGFVSGLPRIGVDDVAVMRAATRHLIDLGHTRIGLVGGTDVEGLNQDVPVRRAEGWERELQAAGHAIRPDWVVSGGFRLPPAKHAVAELLAVTGSDRPSGLVCMSDEMAMGAILAIREAGLSVPGDISVVGIDGHPFAESFGLTTYVQGVEEQGRMAAERMVALLSGQLATFAGAVTPHELIVRSSTSPPAA
jgi:DNA-binding LacI/PurR family transcriptional regulator